MDRGAPLVSVVIATYNWSCVLRYALLSAQAQSFTDFEVLVIGDGCTDDSAEVVAALRDPRFRWENLSLNHGHQSTANNRGIALARGKWIAYLGHDDLWMPNHLEILVRELESKDADVAFSLAIVLGAPDCGGRRLLGVFENGHFTRESHIPPSAVLHRKSLISRCGNWPDHRLTRGSPESDLFTRFLDAGARFVAVSEVTVFKFPSSWRPHSYTIRSCDEQADFFYRMQHQPDFLQRELVELGIAQELLKPHTRIVPESRQAHLVPGALIERLRRNRGLESEPPEQGPAVSIPSPAMSRFVDDEIARRQRNQFAVLEIFYAREGRYDSARQTSMLIPVGRWTRVRVSLEQASEGGPLRIDPCDCPAAIEIAGISLRRGSRVEWRARGTELARLVLGGDAVRVAVGRTLTVRSLGADPMLFLPREVVTDASLVLDFWIRLILTPPSSLGRHT
jgi:glycosyltransferase involved in cell wall biosynthesis